jgi:hypothetical protein
LRRGGRCLPPRFISDPSILLEKRTAMTLRSLAALSAFTIFLGLSCTLFGCGSQEEKKSPMTADDYIKKIQNSPNMTPEQKQAVIDNFRSRRQTAGVIGAARQKIMSKKP